MKRSIKELFVVGVLLGGTCVAATHDRNWQEGKLLDAQKSSVYLGTYANSSTYGTGYSAYSSGSSYNRFALQESEVVDGGDKVYIITRVLKYRWNKQANLTVNGPVKFSVDGQNMYLLDEDGREIKAKIIKKTMK